MTIAKNNAQDEELAALLNITCNEALHGLDQEHGRQIIRRIERTQEEVLRPFLDRPVMLVFLVVMYWLQDVLEREILVLTPGSPADAAITAILANLEEHAKTWDDMERSAKRNAVKLGEHLNRLGYYTQAARKAA
jgi:hypothetical protein